MLNLAIAQGGLCGNEELDRLRRRIESLKQDGYAISLAGNPEEATRRHDASTMWVAYSNKVSENLNTAIRYVMITAAVAMATSLTAIAQAWDKAEFVTIVSRKIVYRFIPALLFAWTANMAFNVADTKFTNIWRINKAGWTTEGEEERKSLSKKANALIMIGTVCLAVSVGLQLLGASDMAKEFLQEKAAKNLAPAKN